jgi:hypothetical protein
VHGLLRGALVGERGPRGRHGGRRALLARAHRLRRRRAAPVAPRWIDRMQGRRARRAERPRPIAAPRACSRIRRVEEPSPHGTDPMDRCRHAYGKATSTAAPPPRSIASR